jgi:hypothetical protein
VPKAQKETLVLKERKGSKDLREILALKGSRAFKV